MTHFSRFLVNPQRRAARKLLASPQAMHAAVLASFPPDLAGEGRVLWRLDSQQPEHRLYVLSPEAPDFTHLIEQAGWATRTWDTTDYTPMLDRVAIGQEWGFRLRANPVKSMHQPGRRGKTVPHVTVKQQIKWLAEKAQRNGFEIRSSATADTGDQQLLDVQVTHRADVAFNKTDGTGTDRRRVTLRQAQFDGILRVTDAQRLREAMTNGIGRGKAYGCGLLTLRSLR